jgi:hypothetical protein
LRCTAALARTSESYCAAARRFLNGCRRGARAAGAADAAWLRTACRTASGMPGSGTGSAAVAMRCRTAAWKGAGISRAAAAPLLLGVRGGLLLQASRAAGGSSPSVVAQLMSLSPQLEEGVPFAAGSSCAHAVKGEAAAGNGGSPPMMSAAVRVLAPGHGHANHGGDCPPGRLASWASKDARGSQGARSTNADGSL